MLEFLDFSILDILDIVLVAVLLYYVYKLLKGTVAINIFIGIALIVLIIACINFMNLATARSAGRMREIVDRHP